MFKHKMQGNHILIISILLLITACISAIFVTISPAFAEDAHYNFPNAEIKKEAEDDMMKVDTAMLTEYVKVFAWAQTGNSYLMTEKDGDGHVSLIFNAPSIKQQVTNYLLALNPGGWISASGYQREASQDMDSNNWTTAKKKYGYVFPNAAYVGEYPAPLISIESATLDGFAVKKVVKITARMRFMPLTIIESLFTGKLDIIGEDDIMSLEEIKNITYSTNDYRDASLANLKKYAPWLEKYWIPIKNAFGDWCIKIDGKSAFEDGVILEKGETVGSGPGQVNGEELLDRIIRKCQGSTPQFLTGLTGFAHDNPLVQAPWPHDYIIRYMPYDYSLMSAASQEYMNGVTDPRVEMFKNNGGPLGLIGTTVKSLMHSVNSIFILGWTATFCDWAGTLNSICDFKVLEANGLNLFFAWEGSLGQLMIIGLGIIAVIFMLKSLFKFLSSNGSRTSIIFQAIAVLFILILCAALLVNPQHTGKALTNITSSFMSLGTKGLETNSNFQELYTSEASSADKSELRFWALWYNTWTSYAVSHDFNDSANKYDSTQGGNEYTYGRETSNAKLKGDVPISLWGASLLEDLSNNDANNASRTIDHYIAPKINIWGEENGSAQFTVENNPNYNSKYPYSVISIGSVLLSFSILLITIIKVLCFLELVINIIFLFIRIIYSTFWGSAAIKETFKELAISVGRVIVYDIWITLYIYIGLVSSGEALTFIGIVIFIITLILYAWLFSLSLPGLKFNFNSRGQTSLLRPGLIDLITNGITRGTHIVKETAKIRNDKKQNKKEYEDKKHEEHVNNYKNINMNSSDDEPDFYTNQTKGQATNQAVNTKIEKEVVDATKEGIKSNAQKYNIEEKPNNTNNNQSNSNNNTAQRRDNNE